MLGKYCPELLSMEQLNLDHMLTNSLDHLSVHSIVLWTRVGSEKANNIMPEQRTSRALLRLLSDWNFLLTYLRRKNVVV